MQIQNSEIAEKFNQLADLLEIEGANPFRIRAYRNAARTLLGCTDCISALVEKHEDLTELPSIGKDLAQKICEIVATGHFKMLEDVQKHTPKALCDFLKIPALGPKRVQVLYKKCGVKNLNELKKFVESEKFLKVKGFGEKTRVGILEGLKKLESKERRRFLLNEAQEMAELVVRHLKKSAVNQVTVAGSFRRGLETVGDLDIVATARSKDEVMKHFLKLESIVKVISKGNTRATVVTRSGMQVDLRVVPDVSYGAALPYFTGSKAHNIALRALAQKKGLKINEYGVFKKERRLLPKSEEEIYQLFKLPYIEPELRENRGEIEAAFSGALPKLVTLSDIKGDLHIHTYGRNGRRKYSKRDGTGGKKSWL